MLDILVILDRSGSMQDKASDHEGGLRSFVNDQKSLPGDVRFTLVQFDTEDACEIVYDRTKIADVGLIRLIPRGGTPLLDAIGKAVSHLELRQATEPSDQTIAMVVTDGEENSSHEWTKTRVAERIKTLEGKAWSFLFLAANVDAFAEAGGIGIHATGSANYSHRVPGSVSAAYGISSNKIGAVRMAGARGMSVPATASFATFYEDDYNAIAVGSDVAFDPDAEIQKASVTGQGTVTSVPVNVVTPTVTASKTKSKKSTTDKE